jgi:hypothetical protein
MIKKTTPILEGFRSQPDVRTMAAPANPRREDVYGRGQGKVSNPAQPDQPVIKIKMNRSVVFVTSRA